MTGKKGAQGDDGASGKNQDKRGWNGVFNLNKSKEKRHDDPALGET